MGAFSVVIAAVLAWVFGALWYGVLGKAWLAAEGLKAENIDRSNKTPFLISFVCVLLVAGMMRHILAMSGIDTIGTSALTGFGLGLFIATPWIVTNAVFAQKPRAVSLINGGYAVIGCTIIAAALAII